MRLNQNRLKTGRQQHFSAARKKASLLAILATLFLLTPTEASAETFEIFYDSFESPVVSNRVEGLVPGWKGSDTRIGLWNVNSGTMSTPFGSQAVYVWNLRNMATTNITEKLTGGVTYTLTFNVAAESGLGGIKYKAEILAGTNVLTSVTASTNVTNTNFSVRSDTLQFVTPSDHLALGQALGIRLSYLSGDWHYVIGFDNVRLVADETDEWRRTLFFGK